MTNEQQQQQPSRMLISLKELEKVANRAKHVTAMDKSIKYWTDPQRRLTIDVQLSDSMFTISGVNKDDFIMFLKSQRAKIELEMREKGITLDETPPPAPPIVQQPQAPRAAGNGITVLSEGLPEGGMYVIDDGYAAARVVTVARDGLDNF